MRITWLISSAVSVVDGPTDKPESLSVPPGASLSVPPSATRWYSPLASLRYRVLAPARYLQNEGHRNQFLRLDQKLETGAVARALAADVVVVSKVLARGSVELAEQARKLGARVVVDLCDDHFDTPELGPAYRALCQTADRVVASTAAMARVIGQRTGKRAAIIDDPYEGPHGQPRFEPVADGTRLLWFGHPVNFDTLADMVPRLAALARRMPLSLHVVSDPTNNGIRAFVEQVNTRHAPGLTARFTVWSPEATWQALADCDLVVVPSLPSAKKLVKSPNRVVEPLRAGRFVVAYPLPSYVELGEFVWLGDDMAEGVEWALAHRAEVRGRIEAGQKYVHRRFDPLAIARVWEAVLLQTVECEREAA